MKRSKISLHQRNFANPWPERTSNKLIKEVAESHEPVTITGKESSAVLISEDDWRAIQETLYLLSIPGMTDSIRTGLKTPVEQCDDQVNW